MAFKKKEKEPALEINLNLIPLLESLGLDKVITQATDAAKKGQTQVIDKIATRIQQGGMEVQVSVGNKKRKVPVSFTLKMKKQEK